MVSPQKDLWWAWLGGGEAQLEQVHERLVRASGPACTIGAGRPAAGPAGFRCTHRQAQAAHHFADLAGRAVCLYRDVALEALALRDTLASYFAHGQNGASAAAALGVSPRTLSYRLRAIEDVLGTPIRARSAELSVALRLERALGTRAATPGA